MDSDGSIESRQTNSLLEYGLSPPLPDTLLFVHGTTTEDGFSEATRIRDEGAGEFGAGFYTFLATGPEAERGIWAARERAVRKAADPTGEDQGVRPCLVFVGIATDDFLALDSRVIDETGFELACASYWPRQQTGHELVVGPVAKSPRGKREPNPRLPTQFKFEGRGTRLLRVDRIDTLDLE